MCKRRRIAVVAYGSLGCGHLVKHPEVADLAKQINKSPAQVRLAPTWDVFCIAQMLVKTTAAADDPAMRIAQTYRDLACASGQSYATCCDMLNVATATPISARAQPRPPLSWAASASSACLVHCALIHLAGLQMPSHAMSTHRSRPAGLCLWQPMSVPEHASAAGAAALGPAVRLPGHSQVCDTIQSGGVGPWQPV